MLDFADQRGSAAGPIRPIWGSTFAARSPVWVRAMREIADQMDSTGPTGFGSAALSMTAEPMQDALSLDNRNETQEDRERREETKGTISSKGMVLAEPAARACRLSPAGGPKPSLCPSLILDLRLYLSSPSQNLNLRPSSIRLCGAENDLRTWPPRGRASVYLRSRKGACRTLAGRLFGPIGRLFRPSGHDLFGVALAAPRPCVGQALVSNNRQGNGWAAIDNMTARIPPRTPQTRKRTFVDICAERGYPGAMEHQHTALRPSLRLCLRPSLHLWLHRSVEPEAHGRRSQRGLRAWLLADISTQPPHRNIRLVRGALVVLAISFFAPLALGAFAIASALAPQRFAGSTAPIALGATAIASALARQRLIASALASQRSGIERPRAWRLA